MNQKERLAEIMNKYQDSPSLSTRLIDALDPVPYEPEQDDEVIFNRSSDFTKESRMKVRELLEVVIEIYDPDLIALFLKESMNAGHTKVEIINIDRAAPAPHHINMRITGPIPVIKALIEHFDLM